MANDPTLTEFLGEKPNPWWKRYLRYIIGGILLVAALLLLSRCVFGGAGRDDIGLGGAQIGDRTVSVGDRLLHLGLGGDAPAREAADLLQAAELSVGLSQRRLVLADRGDGGVKRRLALVDRVLEARGIDEGERLTRRDAVVHIDHHLGDETRQFRADLDLVGRGELAGGRDGDRERSPRNLLGSVFALGRAGEPAAREQEEQDHADADEHPFDITLPGRGGLNAEKVVDIAAGRIGHDHSWGVWAAGATGMVVLSQPPPRAR